MVGPGVNQQQMSVQREFCLTEKGRLKFRMDAFNVFNHAQFNGINSGINFSSLTNAMATNPAYTLTAR